MAIFYEAGRYRGVVTAQGLSKASTGTPQLFISFEPIARVTAPDHEEGVSQCYERTYWRALTDASLEYAIQDLKNLNVDVTSLFALDPGHPGHVSIVGQEHFFVCKHETSKSSGDLREVWAVGRTGGGFEKVPVDVAGLKRLDALFGAAKKKTGLVSRPAIRPVAQVETLADQGLTDDDVPFLI